MKVLEETSNFSEIFIYQNPQIPGKVETTSGFQILSKCRRVESLGRNQTVPEGEGKLNKERHQERAVQTPET